MWGRQKPSHNAICFAKIKDLFIAQFHCKLIHTPRYGCVYERVNLTAKPEKLRVRQILLTTKYSESKPTSYSLAITYNNIQYKYTVLERPQWFKSFLIACVQTAPPLRRNAEGKGGLYTG